MRAPVPVRVACLAAVGAVVAVGLLLVVGPVRTAGAQAPGGEPTGGAPVPAEVELEPGAFDEALGDWTVDAVVVRSGLDEGVTFSVTLLGAGGRVLWTGAAPYAAPATTLPVDGVRVGEVTDVELGSALVLGNLVTPEVGAPASPGGGGSTGQVATSMALVIIVAVILFRTPLPAAATQRWTR